VRGTATQENKMTKFKPGDLALMSMMGEEWHVVILSEGRPYKLEEGAEGHTYRIHPVAPPTSGAFANSRGLKITTGIEVADTLLTSVISSEV
jgi:hypothetical protein